MDTKHDQVDPQGWETLERNLCRLAKIGEGKLEVIVDVLNRPEFLNENPMAELEKVAKITFRSTDLAALRKIANPVLSHP